MKSLQGRRILFLLLALVYTASAFLLVRHAVLQPVDKTLAAPLRMLPLIGRIIGITYAWYLLSNFLVGRVAGEYIFLLPLLNLIAAYLGTLVLLLAHIPLSGPGKETPLLFGSLYSLFSVLVAIGLWRRHLGGKAAISGG